MSTVIQTNIEEEITRLSDELEKATGELSSLAQRAATAEVSHKREFSKALLRVRSAEQSSEGRGKTAAEREAEAFLVTDQEFLARRIAEGHHSTQLEIVRSLRSQLSALQTLARAVSQQAGMS